MFGTDVNFADRYTFTVYIKAQVFQIFKDLAIARSFDLKKTTQVL